MLEQTYSFEVALSGQELHLALDCVVLVASQLDAGQIIVHSMSWWPSCTRSILSAAVF